MTAAHVAIRRAAVNRKFTKEMCHEEIHHHDRVDLAAHHPGHRDCERGPCVAVELRIRRQRLLTSSRASEHSSRRLSMLRTAAVWHSRDGRPPAAGANKPKPKYSRVTELGYRANPEI